MSKKVIENEVAIETFDEFESAIPNRSGRLGSLTHVTPYQHVLAPREESAGANVATRQYPSGRFATPSAVHSPRRVMLHSQHVLVPRRDKESG